MQHISHQFDRELEKLSDALLLMGGTLESMLKDVRLALETKNFDLARKIIQRDFDIDQTEKKIDEMVLQIIALRQPAAQDLRTVVGAMKICTDLERVGDVIVNMAERVVELESFETFSIPPEIFSLIDHASELLEKSLDAFVRRSTELASVILKEDKKIDAQFMAIWEFSLREMKAKPELMEVLLKQMFLAKHLERLSDHATNIAEQVIFVVKGLDIRHSGQPTPTP